MKIISLNIWGGRVGPEKLLGFFEKYKADTDIFCLQEVWAAPYHWVEGKSAGGKELKNEDVMTESLKEISEVLGDFEVLFHPHLGDNYGLAMFVKKTLPISASGEVFVYQKKGYYNHDGDIGDHARNIQYVTLEKDGEDFTVVNFHGLWNGKGKTDTEPRLEQSDKILQFTKKIDHPFVVCGDFNVKPDTESLLKFERAGLRNLISEYGITSTRTSYYEKPEKFADYAFTSPDLEVVDFQVILEEVSDHAPLLIEIK